MEVFDVNEFEKNRATTAFNFGKANGAGAELKRLKQRIRNQVRAISAEQKEEVAVKKMNKLREELTPKELFHAERAIRALNYLSPVLPEYFPKTPQTKELYYRLEPLALNSQIELVECAVVENYGDLKGFFSALNRLNKKILDLDLNGACNELMDAFEVYGYSHILLRKAVLVRYFAKEKSRDCPIELILNKLGAGESRIIISSLIHCFQDEQDFINMKRSIMGIAKKGNSNRFTRDITRIAFHPHCGDREDLSEMIQSCLQSSLVDAVVLLLINSKRFNSDRYKGIKSTFELIDELSPEVGEIAKLYLESEDPEDLFYKQSSAWFECDCVRSYRCLQDNFYDSPESEYIRIDDAVFDNAESWLAVENLKDLAGDTVLTRHGCEGLQKLEELGTITRSSAFNYLLKKNNGHWILSEDELIEIMGRTSALSRTASVECMKNLSSHMKSKVAKIIIYFLISKRSKNDFDGFFLKRILQERILESNNGSLLSFVSEISEKSFAVARYIYEACNEDFIARLPHIVKTSSEIVENRALLHKWMAERTGEKIYFDRARNLLIDQQINLVKGKIDDNRIYVDPSRFLEWIEAEMSQEINSVLTMLEHNDALANEESPQLLSIFEQCYIQFCSNKYFGIASYLGRRIRHGTFKGHLFSGVVSIERSFPRLLAEPLVAAKWGEWKAQYEKKVDEIIRERLHVESSNKRNGFLQANIRATAKADIAKAGIRDLLSDYKEKGHSYGAPQLIVEYCWRLAEVDLRAINAFLRNQRQSLANMDLINEVKQAASSERREEAKDFSRDIQSAVNERLLSIISWFKRPQVVSPKASMGLLYKAVVSEVNQTFQDFMPETDFDPDKDIELMGGAYHVLYDAFYVVLYNAAKHGKPAGLVQRTFDIKRYENNTAIEIKINSEVKDEETDEDVNYRLQIGPDDDIENAQLYEDRSGIRKLYHLQLSDKNFKVIEVGCRNRKVSISFSYSVVHG